MALAALGNLQTEFITIMLSLCIQDNQFSIFLSKFLGFIFPHKVTGFLEGTLSDELIQNYRDDLDFQNLIDLVQKVSTQTSYDFFCASHYVED